MAITIKKKDAVETVKVEKTTTTKQPGQPPEKEVEVLKDETNHLQVPGVENIPPDKLANVGMSAGFTAALPNYSNCKGQVSLYYPCHIDDIDATFDHVSEWVTAKISTLHDEFTAEDGENG